MNRILALQMMATSGSDIHVAFESTWSMSCSDVSYIACCNQPMTAGPECA